jgi:hypothetical protein
MKSRKMLIVSLLVLSLSVLFMGCPPADEETEWDKALSAIKAIGYSGNVPQPAGCTFDTYGKGGDGVYVAWTGATQEAFTAYKASWAAVSSIKTARSIQTTDFDTFTKGDCTFYMFYSTDGGSDEMEGLSITVKPGSIVLAVWGDEGSAAAGG